MQMKSSKTRRRDWKLNIAVWKACQCRDQTGPSVVPWRVRLSKGMGEETVRKKGQGYGVGGVGGMKSAMIESRSCADAQQKSWPLDFEPTECSRFGVAIKWLMLSICSRDGVLAVA